MEALVLNVSCSAPALMKMELETPQGILRVETADFTSMKIFGRGSRPPEGFHPCTHMEGRKAEFEYEIIPGRMNWLISMTIDGDRLQ